jgi:hypothetical protein
MRISTISRGGTVHILSQQLNPKTCPEEFAGSAKFTVGDGTGEIREIAIARPGAWQASGWMPARSPSQISY